MVFQWKGLALLWMGRAVSMDEWRSFGGVAGVLLAMARAVPMDE